MASQSKAGIIDWLKSLWSSDEPKVIIKRIEGTNIETFKYDGYDVEIHIYSDRVCSAIYLKGRLLIKTYRFSSPEGVYVDAGTPERIWPSYKVRNYVMQYTAKRLKELTEQNQLKE